MSDRILDVLRSLILSEIPELTYFGLWEYAVVAVHDDGTVDGAPTVPTIPLPNLSHVPMSALAAGGFSRPTVGQAFLVEFHDGDAGKYVIVGADPTVEVSTIDATKTVNVGPSAGTVKLGPSPARAIARNGDSLTVWLPIGQLAGVITVSPGPPPVTVPLPPTNTQILNPVPGIVTGGNPLVLS